MSANLILFFGLLVACAKAVIVNSGDCAEGPIITDFDISKYLGTWYEIEKFPTPFEAEMKCVYAKYDSIGTNNISVLNSGVKSEKSSNITGFASKDDSSKPNHLSLHLKVFSFNNNGFYQTSPYNIWSTDYDNYALVYSCSTLIPNLPKMEFAWILSRKTTLDDTYVKPLTDLLDSYNVTSSKLVKTSQDC